MQSIPPVSVCGTASCDCGHGEETHTFFTPLAPSQRFVTTERATPPPAPARLPPSTPGRPPSQLSCAEAGAKSRAGAAAKPAGVFWFRSRPRRTALSTGAAPLVTFLASVPHPPPPHVLLRGAVSLPARAPRSVGRSSFAPSVAAGGTRHHPRLRPRTGSGRGRTSNQDAGGASWRAGASCLSACGRRTPSSACGLPQRRRSRRRGIPSLVVALCHTCAQSLSAAI